jgi:hypothetical protein
VGQCAGRRFHARLGVPMKRALAIALVLLAVTPAWAKKGSKGSSDDDDDTAEDAGTDDDDAGDDKPTKKKHEKDQKDDSDEKADKKDKKDDSSDDDESSDDEGGDKSDEKAKPEKKQAPADDEPAKQDLTGHDLGTKKKTTEFEKDRFFVDKVDTPKTENGTLIQGSLSSSSFYYAEGGGNYPSATAGATAGTNTGPDRMWTDLRLQTDFRHIGGGRWDARIDGRIRFVNDAGLSAATTLTTPENNQVQSGFNGKNEYDLRELWLVRNGVRSDLFLGRQYIPDLGGLKIDGLRVDYASSNKLTLIGFGGLYPLRGSRSLDTDYIALKVPGSLDPAGKYVGATGFGGAYRTINAYGSIGGVAEVPISNKEQARFYITSSGYYRAGSKLDFYHFILADVVGSAGAQLTNLSAGVNGKPTDRLRLTASINHVDTETLAIQAGAFLNPVDQQPGGATVVQNETFIRRLATDEARGSVSAGLGQFQRFQLSTAIAYRSRPAFSLSTGNQTLVPIDDASSVEVWASLVDRHSIKDARIGIEGSNSFGVGTTPYQRNTALFMRGYVGHSIKEGRGEWLAEVSYLHVVDSQKTSSCGNVDTCYGSSESTIYDLGGELYYRLKSNWFTVASLSIAHNTTKAVAVTAPDPAVNSLTGFLRIAYRF